VSEQERRKKKGLRTTMERSDVREGENGREGLVTKRTAQGDIERTPLVGLDKAS